jgi:hypothetical protein
MRVYLLVAVVVLGLALASDSVEMVNEYAAEPVTNDFDGFLTFLGQEEEDKLVFLANPLWDDDDSEEEKLRRPRYAPKYFDDDEEEVVKPQPRNPRKFFEDEDIEEPKSRRRPKLFGDEEDSEEKDEKSKPKPRKDEDDEDDDKPKPKPDDKDGGKGGKKPSMLEQLTSSFMKITNHWGQIVENFKTSRSSEIKERLTGKGFEYFSQQAQIQISKGIKEEHFDKFISHIEKRLKVPAERQDDLGMALEESKWTESNIWTCFNTLFSVDQGGNTKFSSIIVGRNDEKGTYDFIFSDIKADFKLAPDVMIVSKKLSVLGGIWSDSKDEIVKVPKYLNPQDIQTVMNFFQIIAFKGFAEQFGVKLELPSLK